MNTSLIKDSQVKLFFEDYQDGEGLRNELSLWFRGAIIISQVTALESGTQCLSLTPFFTDLNPS